MHHLAAMVAATALFGCETPAPKPEPDQPDAGAPKDPVTVNGCAPTTEGARFALCQPTLESDAAASGPSFQVNADVGELAPAARITGGRFAVVGSLSHE